MGKARGAAARAAPAVRARRRRASGARDRDHHGASEGDGVVHLPALTLGRVLLELCEDVTHELEDSERPDASPGAPVDRAGD
jgi:hypothetical protein